MSNALAIPPTSGSSPITARDVVYDLLRRFGMKSVLAHPGSTELPMFRDSDSDFRYVLGLQEAVVVGMADGYAQATHNAAFVNLHSAEGVGNAMGVQRAQGGGYQALVLTVNVPVSGNRQLNVRNGFRMPIKPSAQLFWDLVGHPRWSLRAVRVGTPDLINITPDPEAAGSASQQAALLACAMDRRLVWESLGWLRNHRKGPLLLKGLLHAEDARLALKHGVDGVIGSNHSGRQHDASPSAVSALPAVVAAVQGRIPVFMDSVRCGSHIAKAICLGATAVFVGRPVLFGLAARGAAGVDAVLKIFVDELVRTMTLLGAPRLGDLHLDASGVGA